MIKYDKLKNVEVEETFFNFCCDRCGADGSKKAVFDIKPIGISWKPDMIDNSDIENVFIRKKLDALPTQREAIEKAIKENLDSKTLSIFCNKCNTEVTFNDKLNISDIRKWMNKNLPKYMDLRLK